jgi:hypothetical protein
MYPRQFIYLAVDTHQNLQQTRQLNSWGFQRRNLSGNVWYHPHFTRGSLDGLEHIKRAKTSGTSKRGPPLEKRLTNESNQSAVARRVIERAETSDTSKRDLLHKQRRATFDSRQLKQVAAAMRLALPSTAPVLGQALDQQLLPADATMPVEATILDPDAMLAETRQKYHSITTQKNEHSDKIRLIIDEKNQNAAAQPVSPAPFPPGGIIGTVEQCRQPVAPMPPSSRPPEHEIRELVEQQQEAKVTLFQHRLPTSVYPSPVTFIDNAPVQENFAFHPSLSYLPLFPQLKLNSSHLRVFMSNVGEGPIVQGERFQPPQNDGIDNDFQLFASQFFESSQERPIDGDVGPSQLSDEVEKEFMNPICF